MVLNDIELGVTRGSRLEQDFDVTEHLVPGANRLVVRVSQWSAQTYVEDQDTWWLPGILRSVTLLEQPADGVGDIRVVADFDARTGTGSLLVETDGPATIDCTELGVEGVATGSTIVLADVVPWNAEVPRLYDLDVRTPTESVLIRIGFRRVEVRNGQLLVNDRAVQLRGVSHHDFHPERGRALTRADLEADVRTMK